MHYVYCADSYAIDKTYKDIVKDIVKVLQTPYLDYSYIFDFEYPWTDISEPCFKVRFQFTPGVRMLLSFVSEHGTCMSSSTDVSIARVYEFMVMMRGFHADYANNTLE